MTETMTGAEIAATRHLLGLTMQEMADMLGVSKESIKKWEAGKYAARPGACADITQLRAEHDAEVARLMVGVEDGIPIGLPGGPKPRGWYLALGARLIDREPDAMLEWA